jgi:hypothetical protein
LLLDRCIFQNRHLSIHGAIDNDENDNAVNTRHMVPNRINRICHVRCQVPPTAAAAERQLHGESIDALRLHSTNFVFTHFSLDDVDSHFRHRENVCGRTELHKLYTRCLSVDLRLSLPFGSRVISERLVIGDESYRKDFTALQQKKADAKKTLQTSAL